MANLKQLRLRIRSIKNTAKLTRTMSMIAASKMRRAQNRATSGKLYKEILMDTLTKLLGSYEKKLTNPLFESSNIGKSAVLLLTTDRGLCGSLNTNLFKLILKDESLDINNTFFYVAGKKGISFLSRNSSMEFETLHLNDDPNAMDAESVIKDLVALFTDKKVGHVYICYNQFVSTLKQVPVIEQLLPFEPKTGSAFKEEPILEPTPKEILDDLVNECLTANVLQSMLDAKASEHSSRMVAMQSATDNAKKLGDELTLFANRARQEAITKELLDIAGAAE